MNTEEIILFISIAFNGFVSVILITQIKKQKSIITSMESYVKIFDIKKVHEFIEMINKTKDMEFDLEAKKIQDHTEELLKEVKNSWKEIEAKTNYMHNDINERVKSILIENEKAKKILLDNEKNNI